MAHISQCSICFGYVCDDTICGECRKAISEVAVYDVDEVRRRVNLNREIKRQEELRALADKCPTCGRPSDQIKYK